MQKLRDEDHLKFTITWENHFELTDKSTLRVKRLIERDLRYEKDPTYS